MLPKTKQIASNPSMLFSEVKTVKLVYPRYYSFIRLRQVSFLNSEQTA